MNHRPSFRRSGPPGVRGSGSSTGPELGFQSREAGSGSIGPFTHAQIQHLMKTEFARARRYGFPITCLLVSIDRQQRLVELYGAELRAKLRQELADVAEQSTRGADHLGTVNEDRYVLVLPHTGQDEAGLVAVRLLERFREVEVEVDGVPVSISLSLGLAGSDGSEKETLFFDTLLAKAEVALEAAISAGGDQVRMFKTGALRGE